MAPKRDLWKDYRKQIVSSILPFTSFTIPKERYPCKPASYFTPMEQINLSTISLPSQEQHLLADLFLVYMGFQGNSIRFVKNRNTITWTVNPSSDPCLRTALYIEPCLPLAGSLIVMQHNIRTLCSDFSRGRVAFVVGNKAEDFFNSEVRSLIQKMRMRNRDMSLTLSEIATHLRRFCQTSKQLNEFLKIVITVAFIYLFRAKESMVSEIEEIERPLDSLALFSDVNKKNLVGGEILSLLVEQIRNCVSPTDRQMLQKFELICLEQYFEILFYWIYYGKIIDVGHDVRMSYVEVFKTIKFGILKTGKGHLSGAHFLKFQATANTDEAKSECFEDRFCVVKALCPLQLEPVCEDIVMCGIYLNVIEKIKEDTVDLNDEALNANKNLEEWRKKSVSSIMREVKKARFNASKDLVLYLRQQFNFHESLHDFMLLQRSDWANSFYELSQKMLTGSIRDISVKKLEILFEESVDCSSLRFNKYRSIFKPVIEKYDILTSLRLISNKGDEAEKLWSEASTVESKSGIEVLSMNIDVKPPLSIIFPPRILFYYTLFFRTFFYITSTINQVAGKQVRSNLLIEEKILLEEMLHFLNAYSLHCLMHVIPELWNVFADHLSKSENLEKILSLQDSFIADVVAQCLLPDAKFTDLLSNLVTAIRDFVTEKVKYEMSKTKWKVNLEKMYHLLSQPNVDISYSQLHSRIMEEAQVCRWKLSLTYHDIDIYADVLIL
ncbi:unnamed protein product [Thelazia callipaeda]|uniref:Gamma-tubulin complex component n=1 Tax=Thelazia callipaeda TaxID=103827 RepID=A0A158RCA7_THECL|nr:unnamed protein product [Thelazia callipaeda]